MEKRINEPLLGDLHEFETDLDYKERGSKSEESQTEGQSENKTIVYKLLTIIVL
jgi:hypothetical protein